MRRRGVDKQWALGTDTCEKRSADLLRCWGVGPAKVKSSPAEEDGETGDGFGHQAITALESVDDVGGLFAQSRALHTPHDRASVVTT